MKKSIGFLSFVAFPLLIAGIILIFWVFREPIWEVFSSPETIEAAVEEWGLWGPLLFFLLQFLQVVIFVIPGEVPQIAGGYLFGITGGLTLSLAGILAGSAFNYYIARFLGVPFIRKVVGEDRYRRFEKAARSNKAKIAFFLFFLIPGIPKDALCYVAGISSLGFGMFLLISGTGRLPGIMGSVIIGSAAAEKNWVLAITILIIAVILFFLGLIFREKLQRVIARLSYGKTDNDEDASSDDYSSAESQSESQGE